MTVHPVALVLADHPLVGRASRPAAPVRCGCWLDDPETGWTGPAFKHPEHLADVLVAAGLLAEAGTVTVEEAPEGDPGMEAVQAWFRNGGC